MTAQVVLVCIDTCIRYVFVRITRWCSVAHSTESIQEIKLAHQGAQSGDRGPCMFGHACVLVCMKCIGMYCRCFGMYIHVKVCNCTYVYVLVCSLVCIVS